ncbi:MAG: hypothetical protein LBS02_07730 [Hungatella sp.]|jgi:hypothetical protein|nr:hypothetical protein [Hungatella sp.]
MRKQIQKQLIITVIEQPDYRKVKGIRVKLKHEHTILYDTRQFHNGGGKEVA